MGWLANWDLFTAALKADTAISIHGRGKWIHARKEVDACYHDARNLAQDHCCASRDQEKAAQTIWSRSGKILTASSSCNDTDRNEDPSQWLLWSFCTALTPLWPRPCVLSVQMFIQNSSRKVQCWRVTIKRILDEDALFSQNSRHLEIQTLRERFSRCKTDRRGRGSLLLEAKVDLVRGVAECLLSYCNLLQGAESGLWVLAQEEDCDSPATPGDPFPSAPSSLWSINSTITSIFEDYQKGRGVYDPELICYQIGPDPLQTFGSACSNQPKKYSWWSRWTPRGFFNRVLGSCHVTSNLNEGIIQRQTS